MLTDAPPSPVMWLIVAALIAVTAGIVWMALGYDDLRENPHDDQGGTARRHGPSCVIVHRHTARIVPAPIRATAPTVIIPARTKETV